jgi:predicted MPP superfamily phosphohydrolase
MSLAIPLLLALAAVGHFSLLVLLLNMSHGLGIRSRWIEPVSLALVIVAGGASLVGLAWLAGMSPDSWPLAVRGYLAGCLGLALVGLPAITVARLSRRLPPGVAGPARVEPVPAPVGPEGWIGDGPRSWILRLPGNESLRPRLCSWSISRDGLPPALDGLSLLHLSDLHFARTYHRAFFEAVADEAARHEADLVLLTGDLLDDDACLEWIEPVLGRLRGRLGTYAILGNHDILHQPDRIAAELGRAGYTVLDGRWECLDRDGAAIAIGGTWEPWGTPLPPLEPADEALRLVLSHSPDTFRRRAACWGADLILSGHNHGGQVRLPVLGPILVPSRYGRRYDQGFFHDGGTLLHVSRGIGAKHPLRLGCPPEFGRLVLRRTPVRPPSHARRVAYDRSS